RGWERAWKLVTHTGISRRVSLIVEEARDEEVAVKIGPNVVDRLVPPWIDDRRTAETLDAEIDRRHREAFNQRILDAVERGLLRERNLAAATMLREDEGVA